MSGPQLSVTSSAARSSPSDVFEVRKSTISSLLDNRGSANDSTNQKNPKSATTNGSSNKQELKQQHNRQSDKQSKSSRRGIALNSSKGSEYSKKQGNRSGNKSSKAHNSQVPDGQRITRSFIKSNGIQLAGIKSTNQNEESSMGADELATCGHIQKQGQNPVQNYTQQELVAAGPLFSDPGALGFMQRQHVLKPRPYPKYMLVQPRLLRSPVFHQSEWDRKNQEKMLEMEAANNGSDFQGLYEEFQKMREVERAKMEELGLVDAENATKDLNDAIFFQGTCLDMCPTFERVRRALENNVKALEKDFSSQKISRARAVKAFSRPAAGQPPPMPSDVRPPRILLKSLDYLVGTILPQLPDSHSFLWDRTRSIRQDFVYQNYYGPEAIDCNERIVRIHLLCMHVMARTDVEYSQQQELEQFNKALQTLMEIYQDVRNHGGFCPNEAEFRAYHLLSHFRDPELERELQTLPDAVFTDPRVQLALRFRLLMSQNFKTERGHTNKVGAANMFVKFFQMACHSSTPALMACLLETHFNEIRFYSLKSLSRSYHTGGKALLGTALQQMLGFDSLQDMIEFVSYYEVDTIYDGETFLVDLCNKEKLENAYKLKSIAEKPKRLPAFSLKIDAILKENPLRFYVDSGLSNSDLKLRETSAILLVNTSNDSQNRSRFGPCSTAKVDSASVPFGKANEAFGASSAVASAQSSKFESPSLFGQNHTSDLAPAFSQIPASFPESAFGQNSSFGQKPGFNSKPTETPNMPSSSDGGSFILTNSIKSDSIVSSQSAFTKTQQFLNALNALNSPKESLRFGNSPSSDRPKPSLSPVKPNFEISAPIQPIPTSNSNFSFTSRGESEENNKHSTMALEAESQLPKIEGKHSESKIFSMFPGPAESTVNQNKANSPHVHFASSPQVKPKNALHAHCKSNISSVRQSLFFGKAVQIVCDEMLDSIISNELFLTISRLQTAESRSPERKKVIDLLSKELFSAFVSEETYQASLESTAQHLYESRLYRRVLRKVIRRSQHALSRKILKQDRMQELESINFRKPSSKRDSSQAQSQESLQKRKKTHKAEVSYTDIHSRQDEIRSLWAPLNLQKFVETCGHNFSSKRLQLQRLDCKLVVENWTLAYSKWLANKFSLKTSKDRTRYENTVEHKDLSVCFESLSKFVLSIPASIQDVSFIVYECGLTDEDALTKYKDLRTKLNRDRTVLDKIVQICDRYCLYKVQILVVLWDASQSGVTTNQIVEYLDIDAVSAKNCVNKVHICNMASNEENVSQLLEGQLSIMADYFDGLLTFRGDRKLKTSKPPNRERMSREDISAFNDKIYVKEQELFRKAKDSHQHGYLTKHIGRNSSVDLTNTSGIFKTPNTSFANRSIQYNKSLLGSHSFSSLGRENSFFRSFANGSILEGSTPFASPRPDPKALPKKILDLRKLTASIKERYKK